MNNRIPSQAKPDGRRLRRPRSLQLAASERNSNVVRPNLTVTLISHPAREQLIAEAAYHRAESRGFESGHELDDWLAAEAEVDARSGGEGRAY